MSDGAGLQRLDQLPLEAVAASVRREITAGNVSGDLALTERGRALLERLLGGDGAGERLEIRRSRAGEMSAGSRWRIDCTSCRTNVAGDVSDEDLVSAVFRAAAGHYCWAAGREVHLLTEPLG